MLKFFLSFLAAVFLPLSASALTINEAVTLALESNNNIKSKEYTVKARDLASSNAILIFLPSIGVQYDYAYAWDDYSKARNEKVEGDSSTFSAYANLNIFNGLADMYAFGMAKLNKDVAVSNLDTTGYDTILESQNAFINLLKAKSDLEVAESNLKLLEMQKRDAQISADNGLIAKNDLLQTEAYLASAQLQKITAASGVTLARQQLEKVINRKLDTNEQLVEPVFLDVTLESEDVLKEKMFANRSDLKALEQSYKIAKKQEMYNMAGIYPKIDFRAGYYGYGDNANPFGGNPMGKDNTLSVGVQASWNLLNIASSSMQSISAKRERQALAYSIADNKQAMLLSLQSAIENYYTSKAQLAQAVISVKHAEENYRVRKNLYDQSSATMTELLDASSLLNQAKVSESNARYSVLSSVYNLERIIQEKLPVHDEAANPTPAAEPVISNNVR